jgi:hypothetical protein
MGVCALPTRHAPQAKLAAQKEELAAAARTQVGLAACMPVPVPYLIIIPHPPVPLFLVMSRCELGACVRLACLATISARAKQTDDGGPERRAPNRTQPRHVCMQRVRVSRVCMCVFGTRQAAMAERAESMKREMTRLGELADGYKVGRLAGGWAGGGLGAGARGRVLRRAAALRDRSTLHQQRLARCCNPRHTRTHTRKSMHAYTQARIHMHACASPCVMPCVVRFRRCPRRPL